MRFLYLNIIFIILFFTAIMHGQVPQDKIKAKLEIEKIEDNIKITSTAENLTEVIRSATYRMSVIKTNSKTKNQSKNDQDGVFTLQPNEFKKLSTSQINIAEGDEVIVLLLFYDEDKQIIAKDRMVLGEEKKKK